MDEQNFYPISSLHLFEQLVSKLEETVNDSYPLFQRVANDPSILPVDEVLRAISVFNENPQMVELSRNQYKKWRADGVTEEQEKQISSFEDREEIALAKNTEILGFLNA